MDNISKASLPLVWDDDPQGKYCVLLVLNDVPRQYEIKQGISRAKDFPVTANFRMDKGFKKQTVLSDNLSNIEQMPVLSQRLKGFIETRQPKNIEFMKVQIINLKGIAIEDEYHIMSPLEVVDCIDKERSKLMWNAIDPDRISGVYELVLNLDRIDPELLLFRPKHLENRIFVRHDFAADILAGGFTGVAFRELLGFTG